MRKQFLLLCSITIFLLLSCSQVFAQLTIQGKVTDEEGKPLPGAIVIIVGTTLGTSTDADGSYSIEVTKPESRMTTVEAKFIGFRTERESIKSLKGKQDMNFSLSQDILQMDQVVVTGTAEAVEKKSLGNSINTLAAKELENVGTSQLDAALTGKIPGALVQVNSGNPGGGTSVRLRGISTLYSGTSDPLYIVDGIIIDNSASSLIDLGGNATNRLADLDPEDVERVEVVKGAAAAALYGSRANNGVVQIFTKRGQAGSMKVRLNSTVGFDQIVKKLDMVEFPYTKAKAADPLTPVTRYDYQDEIFRTAPRYTTNLSLSGGDITTKYFVAGSWNSQAGIIKSSQYDRQSVRFNLDKILNNWLNVSLSTNYVHSLNDLVANGGVDVNGFGVLTGLTQSPNTYNNFPDANGVYPLAGWNPANRANFLDVINNWKSPEEINRYIGGIKFDITPMQGLSIQYRLGYDNYAQSVKYYIPRVSSQTKYPNGYSESVEKNSTVINSNIDVAYNYQLFPSLKTTSAAGMEFYQSEYDLLRASTQDLTPLTELLNGSSAYDAIGETKDKRRTLGYYFQETLNYMDRLYLTGSIRADGASTFGENERWQIFPKFSASYVLSEYGFWQDNIGEYVNSFKLRGALGYSGGQPVSSFGRLSTYTQTTYSGKAGIVNSTLLGNDNLKPERMREWELGTDFEVLKGRIGVEFTYYNKKVEDLIIEQIVNPSSGFERQLQNVGVLTNKGIELLLRTVNFKLPDFTWTSTFTYSTNNPIIEKLYGANVKTTNSWSQTILEEGKAPSTFYTKLLYKDKFDANGLPLRDETLQYLGDPNPDFMWSFTNDFTLWNNLNIKVMFDAVWGYEILDWNTRSMYSALYPNHPDYEKELKGELPWGYCARKSSAIGEFVSDASFIKLREVTVSYTLRNDLIRSFGLSNIQLNLTGRNLFTITDYTGYDPEVNAAGQDVILRGWDFATTPNPRSVIFGVTLNL